jgi:tripeptide aminopeptidase
MTLIAAPSGRRLTELFLALARIQSPSREERRLADAVISYLEGMGVTVGEDATGEAIGGDCGNLFCTVAGDGQVPHIALGAHMDTVTPSSATVPVLDGDGVFRNNGEGVLGADDKAAIAALLHAVELLKASGRAFPTFQLFFTVCEEQGLVGAKHLDLQVLRSPLAAVFDSSGPVGGIVIKAPSQQILKAAFRGRAAHAGVEPERGRSAIVAASRAITAMRLGRLDDETTANIGVIEGGVATNVVPELCEVQGECRGHDDARLAEVAASMVDAVHEAAALTGVDVEVALVHEFRAFALSERSPAVRLSKAAVKALGLQPQLLTAGGGSDANVLNARGIPTVNLDAGMMCVHSPDEYLPLEELIRLCGLAIQMVLLAPDHAPSRREAEG